MGEQLKFEGWEYDFEKASSPRKRKKRKKERSRGPDLSRAASARSYREPSYSSDDDGQPTTLTRFSTYTERRNRMKNKRLYGDANYRARDPFSSSDWEESGIDLGGGLRRAKSDRSARKRSDHHQIGVTLDRRKSSKKKKKKKKKERDED